MENGLVSGNDTIATNRMKKHANNDSETLDVDARFILANERTLLAWIRTALTILAGGVAFTHFNERTTTVIAIGITVTVLGALTALAALKRFNDSDRAIRNGRLPLTGKGPVLQVGLVLAFAIAIVVIELVQS